MSQIFDTEVLDTKELQRTFYRLLYGRNGALFDPTDCTACRKGLGDEVFCRLAKVIKAKKKDPTTLLPVTTNYVESIATLVSGSVLDDGLAYAWTDEGTGQDEFDAWWQAGIYDQVLMRMEKETLAVGMAGYRLIWNNDEPALCFFDFEQYHQDKEGSSLFITRHKQEDGQEVYLYVITYVEADGLWYARHQMFKEDKNEENSIGKEAPHMLEVFFPGVSLPKDGVEPRSYPVKPFWVHKSHVLGARGEGVSMFKSVLGHIQALWLYDIIAVLEQQNNFASKMAIPRDMMHVHPVTGEQVNYADMSYIPVEHGAGAPTYVQKKMAEPFETMQAHRNELKSDMAMSLNIPREIIVRESNSGAIRVEAIKTNKQPFDRLVRGRQGMMDSAFAHAVALWASIYGQDAFEYTIQFKSVLGDRTTDEVRLDIDMATAGYLDIRTLLSRYLPDYTQAQIEDVIERVKEGKEESRQATQAAVTGQSVRDIIDQF